MPSKGKVFSEGALRGPRGGLQQRCYNPPMIGLYAHIPFCEKKCHYCNFVITRTGDGAKESRFLDLFEKEITYRAPALRGRKLSTLYLGGGTPSVLSERELGRVFGAIRAQFLFIPSAEVTIETNPGDMTASKARLLKKLGVTRVSLGAQTFHDRTLTAINRAHNAADIHRSYEALRTAGIDNINLDLMLSLPGETEEDLAYSLKMLQKLNPEHVSIYELVIEDKTVFGKRVERGRLDLPEESLQIRMLSMARGFLEKHGWKSYELLNYAKKGYESRHNRLYWKNEEYVGLGPGAYMYIDGRRSRYAASFDDYVRKATAGDWMDDESEILTPAKKEAESFLLALRTREGADLRKFSKYLSQVEKTTSDFFEKGWLSKNKTHLKLSSQGKFFAESIFSGYSLPD